MQKPEKTSVSFGKVVFHEFGAVLGDNPAVSCGVPISLGPELKRTEVMDMDEFENSRIPRRSGKELIIDEASRSQL